MSKTPYWVTQNLKSFPENKESKYLYYFDTTYVSEGRSPLGKFGEIFVNALYSRGVSLSGQIWIFPKNRLNKDIAHNVGHIFRLICRIKQDSALSYHGTISYSSGGEAIDWQPPNPDTKEDSWDLRPVLADASDNSFELAIFIAQSSIFRESFSLLSYLKELRCTNPFLGYLGLWSFIEIEWAIDPTKKTDVTRSLKTLLEQVYAEQKELKADFNKRLKAISLEVGKSVNEHSIRNLLAHGKYQKVSENWSTQTNKDFHNIHDELFEIMFKGLEIKIRDLSKS